MQRQVMVIAPHPDDETLGCGGTLLRHLHEGDYIHWLVVTSMTAEGGFSPELITKREQEISDVADRYSFKSVHTLRMPTTRLDTLPMSDVVLAFKNCFQQICPEVVYLPYRGDVHTDHRIVSDAAVSCVKWFRHPSVRRVLMYETLSETEFGFNPDGGGFQPNVFVDISEFLEQKISILECFVGELGEFPFPRSIEAVRAQAALRGATSGCKAAEAFMLMREIL